MSGEAAANSPPARSAALDQLRASVIVLVVFHHAVLAYCTFGHVDPLHYPLSTAPVVDAQRWIGFDVAVKLNDAFFMPLMFFLSGLFVWTGLARRGARAFLRGRLLRLGLPFAIAELTMVPLAYYPSYLQAGGTAGFAAFWSQTVTTGPWPSGPPWFIGVLLIFDGFAALIWLCWRRVQLASVRRPGPVLCFGLLLAGSTLLYVPPLLAFGPWRWVSVGPFAVQASRALFYGAYFAAGVGAGSAGLSGTLQLGRDLARHWILWAMLAGLSAIAFVGSSTRPASGGIPSIVAGAGLALYCALACFGMMAAFVRFGGRAGPVWVSLATNSFAIYLLHYPAVTWLQYALLDAPAHAIAKGGLTFVLALAASWAAAWVLRRVPGATRVV